MIVDRVVRDVLVTIRHILEGLDHNLTIRDNFADSSRIAYIDPTTATPEQIVQALITAGIMKSS